jgi:hypothetical protein
MIHDDTLPDRPEDDGPEESEYERFEREQLERDGLVERNGVLYGRENDPFAVSCLVRKVAETHELLQEVNRQLHREADDAAAFRHGYVTVQQHFDSLVESYRRLEGFFRELAERCDRLTIEKAQLKSELTITEDISRDQQAELAAMRSTMEKMRKHPFVSAGILLYSALRK